MTIEITRMARHASAVARTVLVALAAGFLVACASGSGGLPAGITEPDRYLHEKGTEALNERRWFTAREYFRQLYDGYPQSSYRADAKLGIADTYLGEGTTEGYLLAINEFKEFLTFYPTHPRADYAQYKLAMAHYYQMAKPERDQTETKAAIQEFEAFLERFPNSKLTPEVKQRLREARDRLSTSEYQVGLFYYRAEWYPGAIDRFKDLLEYDPEYTYRDAVYHYLGESLVKVNLGAEALPYFERLTKEFEKSEYLENAQKRIAELKSAMASSAPAQTPPPKPEN